MPLVELPGFEQEVRRHAWKGSLAIAVYEGKRTCGRCSVGEVVRMTAGVQGALFYHGGYGASEEKTVDVCLACGRVSIVGFRTLNPRRT
jgi:hypothetical protein